MRENTRNAKQLKHQCEAINIKINVRHDYRQSYKMLKSMRDNIYKHHCKTILKSVRDNNNKDQFERMFSQ